MAVNCFHCCGRVDETTHGRLPPWCPRCGADLKNSPAPAGAPDANFRDGSSTAAIAVAPAPPRSGIVPRPRRSTEQPVSFDESQPIAVYRFGLMGYLHTVGPAILLAAIFAAIAALLFGLAATRPGSGTAPPALLMVALAIGFIVPAFLPYGKRVRRVEVFADGIRWLGPQRAGRMAWTDVKAVYRSEIILNGFRKSELKILGTGGEVVFDLALDRFAEFATLVQERCAEVMRPGKREDAAEGGAEFGPVLIGPAGMSLDGWHVPWEVVTRYEVSRGRLWLHYQGGSKCLPLHGIPNYLVLLYLMGEFAPPTLRRASGLPVPDV